MIVQAQGERVRASPSHDLQALWQIREEARVADILLEGPLAPGVAERRWLLAVRVALQ